MARETSRDRRERVAEMQAAQKRAERRRLFVVIGACVAVLAIIGAAVAWAIIGEQNKKNEALANINGDVAAASCDAVTNDPASGSSDHVGPGTNQRRRHQDPVLHGPARRAASTSCVPAVDSPPRLHRRRRAPRSRRWCTTSSTATPSSGTTAPSRRSRRAAFQALATKVNAMKESADKFLVSPWDPAYGAFPAGKKYALSHWSADVDQATGKVGAQMGHRQLCGGLNTTVVEDFVKKYPWSSAPEPGAA